MQKLALRALLTTVKDAFPEIGDRIYLNWPSPQLKEVYPYMVIFVPRTVLHRLERRFVKRFENGDSLYSTGYFVSDIDINYMAKEGEEEDQADVTDKISDLFNIDFSTGREGMSTEASIDIPYNIQTYQTTANFRLLDIVLDQQGHAIQRGDRRSIITISADIPRFKIVSPPEFKRFELDVTVKE